MNTIEITLSDGTVANWNITDDLIADEVCNFIENLVGQPQQIKL